MTSYKELGLSNTVEMFKKAVAGGYAIPAYNFNNMEQMQAIVQACVETRSPVIMQVSSGARKYANSNLLRNMARGAVEYAAELGYKIPIVLHLDHGGSMDRTCRTKRTLRLQKKSVNTRIQGKTMSPLKASWAYWQALKTMFLQNTQIIPSLMKWKIS